MKTLSNRFLTRRSRGSVLMLCMVTVLTIGLVSLALFSMSSGSSRMSYKSWQKTQADSLAESGIYTMYAQIANVPANGVLNTANISTTSMTGTIGGSGMSDGTYSATIVSSSTSVGSRCNAR